MKNDNTWQPGVEGRQFHNPGKDLKICCVHGMMAWAPDKKHSKHLCDDLVQFAKKASTTRIKPTIQSELRYSVVV